jgi:hypothetical protein
MYRIAYQQQRGDPFFGSVGRFFGGIAKTIGGLLPGPAGAVLKGVGGVIAPPRGLPAPVLQMPTGITQVGPGGVIYKRTEYGAQMTGMPQMTDGCGKGFHVSTARTTKVPDGSPRCVRNRRMDPLNAKALRRSARRITAFRGIVKSVARAAGIPITTGAMRRRSSGKRCGCK